MSFNNYIYLCNHHSSQVIKCFPHSKEFPHVPLWPTPNRGPSSRKPQIEVPSLQTRLACLGFYISGVI